jgi:hypothetical protein
MKSFSSDFLKPLTVTFERMREWERERQKV